MVVVQPGVPGCRTGLTPEANGATALRHDVNCPRSLRNRDTARVRLRAGSNNRTPCYDVSDTAVSGDCPVTHTASAIGAALLALAAGLVAASRQGDGFEPAGAAQVKTGVWGGQHARLEVAAGGATIEYDCGRGTIDEPLVLDAQGRFAARGRHVPEPAVIPDMYVFGPNGFQRPVTASKLAAGSFRVRLAIGKRQGLFRVRPLAESRAFPEIGLYRQEEEMTDYGSNDFVLRQISAATGEPTGLGIVTSKPGVTSPP